MRPLTLRAPNFQCVVRDRDDTAEELLPRLEYARTEQEVRDRLASRFEVLSVTGYDFQQWRRRARNFETAFQAAKPYSFNGNVWSEIKQFLYSLSGDLCGYCEARVFVVSQGEVEHYRPKGAVSGEPAHPGYYWLAYDFDNYVPTCPNCNGGKGKRNQFPVRGPRARTRGEDLNAEQPLLLNPFKMDPKTTHFKFVVGEPPQMIVGRIEGVTEEGRESEQVYRLNRGDLVRDRRREIAELWKDLSREYFNRPALDQIIAEVREGRRPYPATLNVALAIWFEWLERTAREDRARARSRRRSRDLAREVGRRQAAQQ